MSNAQAKKFWVGEVLAAMADKSKADRVIDSMDQTLFGLWMGRLRGKDMAFYKWLTNKKRELVEYVYPDNVHTR